MIAVYCRIFSERPKNFHSLRNLHPLSKPLQCWWTFF